MSKLIEVTPENLEEIKNRIKDFAKHGPFIQTHDWIYSPLGKLKKYNELTFNYSDNIYQSGTVSLNGYSIELTDLNFMCEFCDESCGECDDDDILTLAYVGDEIEFDNDYINVVSYGYGKKSDGTTDGTIVVWRLYRKENK